MHSNVAVIVAIRLSITTLQNVMLLATCIINGLVKSRRALKAQSGKKQFTIFYTKELEQ
jgi:hypothetical protein